MSKLGDVLPDQMISKKFINLYKYNIKKRSYLNDKYELITLIYDGKELECYQNKVRITYFPSALSFTSYCKFLEFLIYCQVLIMKC